MNERIIPVKVGDRLTVISEGVGKSGDPFFKTDGYTVFVKEAPEGVQKMRVEITRCNPTVGIAKYLG